MGGTFQGCRVAAALGLLLALGLGCASLPRLLGEGARYRYFSAPDPSDAWTPKIAGWQSRERAERAGDEQRGPASVSGSGREVTPQPASDLRTKYESFLRERKQSLAREVAAWIQREARRHYVPDGPVDHWATLDETLDRDGDDCDGLELLVFHFLRGAGFGEDEVFRAIVYRPDDGQHHMVTLWFESPDDPFVIDPTGAMTTGMPRMSEVPQWVPLKIFDDRSEFTVERTDTAAR